MPFTLDTQRQLMVDEQIVARGLVDPAILHAFRSVPREAFLPAELHEFAYHDVALPVGAGVQLPPAWLVACALRALDLSPEHRVLVVGAGTGYAAALLCHLVAEVVSVDRQQDLTETAERTLQHLGLDRARFVHADPTRGWPPGAPWDRVLVLAGGPQIPPEPKAELADGGVMVVPVGDRRAQRLLRIVRRGDRFEETDFGTVHLVPLVGEAGFQPAPHGRLDPGPPLRHADLATNLTIPELISQTAEPVDDVETASLQRFLDRTDGCRVVLLGESTHGTSEFYRMRARMTQELVEHKGFRIVAVEADWPDAARIDAYVRHLERPAAGWQAFSRFPTWMWRNEEFLAFVEWLRAWNRDRDPADRAAFYGLDLYSLSTSMEAVVSYLDDVDPDAAAVARERYACLTAWQDDPAAYGRSALTGAYRTCEREVVTLLGDLLAKRLDYARNDGDRFLDAAQNARLAAQAERYYRAMYYGARESWNLRDRHMFDTLIRLLRHHGPTSRAVVWEHNSHIGDASATEFAARGELNLGQLCRERFGRAARLVGFGTDRGTVAAAHDWDGPMEIQRIRPSRADSAEHLFRASGLPGLILPFDADGGRLVAERLDRPRLQRAIGVVYRPRTELQSHYFEAVLPRQFDEYVWFEETEAVTPLRTEQLEGEPDTFPFAL